MPLLIINGKEMVVKPKLIILAITACFCLIPAFLQAVIDPTIVLYLPFDEGTGKTAKDVSDFGNHATFMGNGKAKWTAEGKDNSAIEFTSGGYLVVNDADSLDLTTAMTISMWAKLMVKTGECCQGGVEKEPAWQAGEYNLLAEYNGSILLQMMELPDACNDDLLGPGIIDKTWHHVAGTWDGKMIRLYLDGDEVGEMPCKGKLAKGSGDLFIGCRGGVGRWTEGFLDEIKMYNRPLTEAEIVEDMKNPKHNLSVSPADKVATTWAIIKSSL